MKRLIYFIVLMLSFVVVSCNHDIDYDYPQYVTDTYNAAFIKTFGQPASNQTWGFSSISATTRSAQPNSNQWGTNEWDGRYLNFPRPADITESERAAVLEVFNQKGAETYTALVNWDKFFVQQVYKGETNYKDGYNQDVLGSDKMNQLACGDASINFIDEVNNFNNADGSLMLMFDSSTKDWSYKSSQSGGMRFHYFRMEKINGYYYVGLDFSAEGQNPNEKVQRDYIYNDWIVKIVPGIGTINPPSDKLRIMAEDLSASDGTDFDFNDVVIDVDIDGTTANCVLVAAGGTLPLRINGSDDLEVHKMFNVATNVMVNTQSGHRNDYEHVPFILNGISDAKNIKLEVFKNGSWVEMTANQGTPAAKIAVPQEVDYCNERQGINFGGWVQDVNYIWW